VISMTCALMPALQRQGWRRNGIQAVAYSLALLSVVFCVLPSSATGQETGKPTASKQIPETITKEFIERRIEEIKQDAGLKDKEDLRKRILDHYAEALKQLEKADAHQKRLQELQALQQNADRLLREARRELTASVQQPAPEEAEGLSLAELRTRLVEAQTEKTKAEADLANWQARKDRRQEREPKIDELRNQTMARLAEIEAALTAQPPAAEPPEAVPAWRIRQLAEKQALQSELALLNAEKPIYETTAPVIDEHIRAAQLRLKRAEEAIKFWEGMVEKHRGTEAETQLVAVKTLKDNLTGSGFPEPLRTRLVTMAESNLQWAQRRTQPDGTVSRLVQSAGDMEQVEAELKKLEETRKNLQQKLAIEGIENYIGPELLTQRRRLPNPDEFLRRIRQRTGTLSQLRLNLLDVEDALNELVDIETRAALLLETLPEDMPPSEQSRMEAAAKAVLIQRRKILKSLEDDYSTLLRRLAELSAKEGRLIDQTEEVRLLIDKHILWVPTTRPLGLQHLHFAGRTITWLLTIENWHGVRRVLVASLFDRPVVSFFAVLLLTAAIYKFRPMRRRLRDLGRQAGKGFTEPFLLTLEAAALTVILSAIGPAVLLFLGWNLATYSATVEMSSAAAGFVESVGMAVEVSAVMLLTLEFLRRMFRPHGLADAHFRWRDVRLQMIRRHLRWFMPSVVSGTFFYVLISQYGQESHTASLGRLLLIGLLLLGSVFLAVVLHNPRTRRAAVNIPASDHGPAAAFTGDHAAPQTQPPWWRIGVYLLAVLSPVVLAGGAVAGYLYTAELLTWKLLSTAWLGVVLILLHSIGMRWLYHARGRMALEQAQAAATAAPTSGETQSNTEQQAASGSPEVASASLSQREPQSTDSTEQASSKESEQLPATSPQPARNVSLTETNLATINTQTRRLLRLVIGSTAVVGLWLIWVDVLPALEFLDVSLWSTEVETTRMVSTPQGTTVPEQVTSLKEFTLGNLLVAVAVLVVVFVAASNLPGLMEVGILRRLPIDSGARYAVTTLVRYVIYAVGIITAFNMMGVGWSKVQWLVAALGVGLGFGLQEIFANFMSGIILLFERPLRVGDVVTIGEVTGTVTRIQIRATTVRDWDRKEFVVPNKDLVTGNLMNWTLSDQIVRIVIEVGVKYGSDGDRVHVILMDAVTSNPDVLDDPEPRVTFEGFGDSALKFIVRACVPDITKFLSTKHALHTEIQRRLKAAGIEIPFPQRDLHIRSDATLGNGSPHRRRRETAAQQQPGVSAAPSAEHEPADITRHSP